jgi:glucose/arabinose dehydrogenase/cytochrome c2
MKKSTLLISAAVLILIFSQCNSGTSSDNSSIPSDSLTIMAGEASFNQYCSGCHNFRHNDIGPQLSGITTQVSKAWLLHFIKDPQQVISSGDNRARQLVSKYKVAMPSFPNINDDELNAIIAFLHTHKSSDLSISNTKPGALTDPIPQKIAVSNLVATLVPVTQIPPSSDSGKLPLTRITKLTFQPGEGNLFINDLRGKLYKLRQSTPIVFMDIAELRTHFIHEPGQATGFGSFAFHPGFSKNGLFYTTHTEAPGSGKPDFFYDDSIRVTLQWVLTEWKAENTQADSFKGTSRELIRINMVTGGHGVQEITFNPLAKPGNTDYGILYMGVGDGSSVQVGYPFLSHSPERIWGTIIRIDPLGKNSRNGKYGIAPGNPFTRSDNTKAVREIYAYGFRNPHRITWNKAGQIFVSNIGQGNIESLNLVMPGHDYGWPVREGNFVVDPYGDITKVYPLPANDSIHKITYPVAQFDHDEGLAITGGFEYWGSAIPQIKGKFLFGDIPSGRLFYVDMAEVKQGSFATIKEWKIMMNGAPTTLKKLCGTERVDLHFGRDSNDELYILTKPDGKVYKLVSAVLQTGST